MHPKKITYKVPPYYSEELQLAILQSTKDTISKFLSAIPDVNKITECVSQHFETSVDEILKKGRHGTTVYMKQMLHYFLYHYTELSLAHIGQIGKYKFDHPSVLHSCTSIRDSYYLQSVKDDIEAIKTLINMPKAEAKPEVIS